MYFYDAIAPIVAADSIDWDRAFRASRWGTGRRCAGRRSDRRSRGRRRHGRRRLRQLPAEQGSSTRRSSRRSTRGRKVLPHDFEEPRYFESCMPIEVMAERGPQTLRFGPMRPIGLRDPRTGHRPWAVVQLRPENATCTAYNLVGFQTRLAYPEQQRIFQMIPALATRRVPALRLDPPQHVHRRAGAARHAVRAARRARTCGSRACSPASRATSSRARWASSSRGCSPSELHRPRRRAAATDDDARRPLPPRHRAARRRATSTARRTSTTACCRRCPACARTTASSGWRERARGPTSTRGSRVACVVDEVRARGTRLAAGKFAIVTGGSSGIGAACAKALARPKVRGARDRAPIRARAARRTPVLGEVAHARLDVTTRPRSSARFAELPRARHRRVLGGRRHVRADRQRERSPSCARCSRSTSSARCCARARRCAACSRAGAATSSIDRLARRAPRVHRLRRLHRGEGRAARPRARARRGGAAVRHPRDRAAAGRDRHADLGRPPGLRSHEDDEARRCRGLPGRRSSRGRRSPSRK